jgi:hypothetical protein
MHPAFLFALIAAISADAVTTFIALHLGAVETNRAIGRVTDACGPSGVFLTHAVLVVVAALLLGQAPAWAILVAVPVTFRFGLATWRNLAVIRRLTGY